MHILLTGASSGIGFATARILCAAGHEVTALSRRSPAIIPGLGWIKVDLRDRQAITEIASSMSDDPLDALIHCAGIVSRGAVENMPVDNMLAQLEVNAIAPMLLTKFLAPALRKSKGCVVAVSSLAGLIGSPGNAVYSSSKFALEGFFAAAAYELAHVGIKTRVIVPMYAPTPIMATASSYEHPPAGVYADFEIATRARLDASVNDVDPSTVDLVARVVASSALNPGDSWFDRVVVGDGEVLKLYGQLTPSVWFEHFRSTLQPWFRSGPE